MILVLAKLLCLSRSEEKSPGYQLEQCASHTPYVSRFIIGASNDNLGATVRSGLNKARELLEGVTRVTHIYYLDLEMLHFLDCLHVEGLHWLHLLHLFNISP